MSNVVKYSLGTYNDLVDPRSITEYRFLKVILIDTRKSTYIHASFVVSLFFVKAIGGYVSLSSFSYKDQRKAIRFLELFRRFFRKSVASVADSFSLDKKRSRSCKFLYSVLLCNHLHSACIQSVS